MKHIVFLVLILVLMAGTILAQRERKKEKHREPQHIVINPDSRGARFEIVFEPGPGFGHPSFAIWMEATDGKYLGTLYVTEYVGKGVFRYGSREKNRWEPAPVQRPASLPHWAHKRGILNEEGKYIPSVKMPVPDAITGPTPKTAFMMNAGSDLRPQGRVIIKAEINQTGDWNENWTNNRFPGDVEYGTSAQPALVYAAEVDMEQPGIEISFKPIGHSHPSGADGLLNNDLRSLTTAMGIAGKWTIRLLPSAATDNKSP